MRARDQSGAPGLIDHGVSARARWLSQRWRVILEGLVVVALGITSFWYGRFAFLNSAAPPDYYWMAPAVMVASGQGLRDPLPAKGSALDDFLARRRPSLDAREAVPPRSTPPTQWDYVTRYLYFTVGYWWRIAGIRWTALADVAAALHVLAVLGAYATFRLFTPLLLSLVGALWMCTSSVQLTLVPHVRDFSKGAFILCVIPLVLAVTLRARSRKAIILLSAAAGALIGLGIGFKIDVSIMVPIAMACILLFRGRWPWTDMADKARAIAAFALALIVVGYPVLSKFWTGGTNGFHFILAGYAERFDDSLGITRPVYRVLPYFDDGYLGIVLNARTEMTTGRWPATPPSVEYDQAGRRLFIDLIRHLPADAFARLLGAANSLLNLVFANPAPGALFTRPLPAGKFLTSLYSWLSRWSGWGAALGAMLVVVATLSRPRLGMLTAFLLLVLGGYPSLQFMLRHAFHVQVIPVLALLVLMQSAVVAPFWIRRSHVRPLAIKLCVAAVLLVVATAVPLSVLRAYQSRHVNALFSAFLEGPRTRLEPEYIPATDNKWLVRWPAVAGTPSAVGPLSSAYYIVEFDAQGAQEAPAVALRYRSNPAGASCTRVMSVSSRSGVARFGFETFSFPGHDFEGIEVEDWAKQRIVGVYRMSGYGPAQVPMELRLPSDWQHLPLYQRLQLQGDGHDSREELRAQRRFGGCDGWV